MSTKSPQLPDLEAMAALMERIETAAGDAPQLAQLDLDEVLRFVARKRAIFSGRFEGVPAIARFYFDEPRPYSRRDWAELQRVWPYMSQGPYRVHEPLFHWPDLGLIVVRRATGTPMFEHLWQLESDQRFDVVKGAVHWLRHYTKPKEQRSAMRAASWLAKSEKRLSKQAFARLRPRLKDLTALLARFVPVMAGHAWRVSVSHGDFHPNNLLVHGDTLTGIDTGGSAKLPIYKDMARFLTHMGRRGMHPSAQTCFGVDRGSFELFSDVFELDALEREVWLPFMIGIEALLKAETSDLSRARLRRAEVFYEALLDDLGKIDL